MVILFPLNAASLWLTHWNTGYWAAWAFAVVALTNIPMTIVQAGLSRLLALPHVLAWGPLQVYLVLRLTGSVGGPLQQGEWAYATALAIINAISLTFDGWDSWRWLRGERAVHGSGDPRAYTAR